MRTGKLGKHPRNSSLFFRLSLVNAGSREKVESLPMESCFSPLLHRIDQAIRWHAINPTKPLPPVPEVLQKLSRQPEELKVRSEGALADLIAVSEVKKGNNLLYSTKNFQN